MSEIQRPDISRSLKFALNLTGEVRPFLSDGVSPVIIVGPNAERPYHPYRVESTFGSVAHVLGNLTYCGVTNPAGSGVTAVVEKFTFACASVQPRTVVQIRAGYLNLVGAGASIDITNGNIGGAGLGTTGTLRAINVSDIVNQLVAETEITNSLELVSTLPIVIPPGFSFGCGAIALLNGEIVSGRFVCRVYDWTR